MTWLELFDIVADALLDTLKLLPFLFLTYLLMEFLEHRAGKRTEQLIAKAGRVGPLFGGVLGLLPQCGFSAAASGFYAGRVITVGTLLAVFLATSDEMLPVFIGAKLPASTIFTVLGIKLVVAVLAGFLADLLLCKKQAKMQVVDLCEEEHCHCEKGIFRSALHHTLHIALFLLLINLALGFTLHFVGEERIAALIGSTPVVGECVAALIGLIPNCAASVAIATLYTRGIISAGAMLAGLLTGAGAGTLVLFRTNHHVKENLLLLAVLFAVGVLCGTLLDVTPLATWLGI